MRNLITLNTDGKLALRASNGVETELVPYKAHNVLILLDTSGSMAGTKIEQAKAGAVDFAHSASLKGYATALAVFADRAAMVCDPQTNAKVLAHKIAKLNVGLVGGSTDFFSALTLASKFKDLSAVVLVTDGQIVCAEGTLPAYQSEVLEQATVLKSRGVEIICIGTDDADRSFLGTLATRESLAVHVPSQGIRSAISDASRLLPAFDASHILNGFIGDIRRVHNV